jgi:hypothetical protein
MKLCFPARRSPTLVISIRTSRHFRQETFVHFSIASGRMCIEFGRLSLVASQQHVPVAWAAAHARGVRSRLPLEGRSRWLTSTEGASLRSFGTLAVKIPRDARVFLKNESVDSVQVEFSQ